MIIESLASFYRPRFARSIVYMLQATEYNIPAYLKWLWRTDNFSGVMHRKTLVETGRSKMLLRVMYFGMLAQVILSLVLIIKGRSSDDLLVLGAALIIAIITPFVWAHLIVLPLLAGRWLVVKPKSSVAVRRSKKVFSTHGALKIGVAGSYGKTTMKEILLTVLSEGKKVAATPANKNVAISHAEFAKKLKGDEDILIIEYGEGAPGDVAAFVRTTQPNIGIITGIAPAHLDKYKNLQQAGEDIFSLASYLRDKEVYVNGESKGARPFIKKGHNIYDSKKTAGWTIENVKNTISGISFTLKKNGSILKLRSSLLGRHQIGPLALAAVLAHQLGLSKEQIEKGVTKVKSFEHRMQPYELGGAWVIDDTYNGNIEGMEAGLKLLEELPAKRKVYVTPGLVDQGVENKTVHKRLGILIAKANPEQVVLMKNSVTAYILDGLKEGKYEGELSIEKDPLDFYTNLKHFVAAGDLVLMQNDWPDNYY